MKRPRLSLRLAMLLVAVVAFGLGSWIQVRRWLDLRSEYQSEANVMLLFENTCRANGKPTHEEWLAACREVDRQNREGDVAVPGPRYVLLMHPNPPEFERRRADYFAKLRLKYERAARYPWLPVEPDPPEPK